MTWSEFGRRVEENASQGTDHGTAAPLFVLGNAVQGGVYGEPPDREQARQLRQPGLHDGLPLGLRDGAGRWLGAPSAAVLGGSFDDQAFLPAS